MKTKMRFSKRILSVLLAVVMVVCMLPLSTLTAKAATEAPELSVSNRIACSNEYFKYDKHLYKVTFTNLKKSPISYSYDSRYNYIRVWTGDAYYMSLYTNTKYTNQVEISHLPKSAGDVLNCYASDYYATDKSKPVMIITCMAVGEPTWSWSGSSANAVFTSTDGNATMTVNASVTSSTEPAANCLEVEKITYTATALCNGQTYTDTDTVDGKQGSHSYIYTASGNTVTESCANNCGHSEKATLTVPKEEYTYTGDVIMSAELKFTDNWKGDRGSEIIYADDNINVGTATVTAKLEGKEIFTTFKITEADISDATVVLSPDSADYTGTAATPSVAVTFKDKILTEGKDYTVAWADGMTNVGTYTATIIGKGNFDGTTTKNFTINAVDLTEVNVEQVGTLTYDGGNALFPVLRKTETAPNGEKLIYLYSTAGADYITEDELSFTEAGVYEVEYMARTNDGNYKEYVEKFNVTVNKADAIYTAPTANDLTYNKNLQNLVAANAVNGGEMQFALGTDAATAPADGWSVVVPQGENVGTYYVWYKVIGDSNHNDVDPACVEATIAKADQEASTDIGKIDETISAKNDGKITGVDSTMEYREDGESTYTAITGTEVTGLADGTYFVRYKENENYNASRETEVTIAAGRKLTVTVPQNQVGYTMTTTTHEMDYHGSINVEFKLHEGYSMTGGFQIYNGTEPVEFTLVNDTYVYGLNYVVDDFNFTVEGVADITEPEAEISIQDNKWDKLWNDITVGLFFKETQDVTITADDKGSGLDTIYYYLSDHKLELDEVREITNWQEYNGTFQINPENKYVIYAKAVDKDDNTTYINSDNVVLDSIAPVISGIEDGKIYYTMQRFTVVESNLASVTVNGVNSIGFALGGNVDREYVIVANDEAGNSTTVAVTMKPISDLSAPIDSLTKDNVNSSNEQAVDDVKAAVEAVDTTNATEEEKAALKEIADKAEGLLETIDEVAKATDTENTEKVKDVTAENVTPEDKTDLEKAKSDLEKALEDHSGNYTDGEKKVIEDEIKRIEDALEVIENVEEVEDKINTLPENINKDDEAAIKAAEDAYNTLTDYEKSLVDEDTKKVLEDAKAALAELNKPTDPNSPQTGDNSNLWLWFALLFVSTSGIFGITLYERKRKATIKR